MPMATMDTEPSKQKWMIVCFILATGLVLFYNLWARNLENHGYLRYAEIAREMIRSGDWVVPHHNGEIYVDKPPLIFWLIAIPSWFSGSVTPLTAACHRPYLPGPGCWSYSSGGGASTER